jgi:hypothetical protein
MSQIGLSRSNPVKSTLISLPKNASRCLTCAAPRRSRRRLTETCNIVEVQDLTLLLGGERRWVFSWAQMRLMLPGWYGFGSAVQSWLEAESETGMQTLQEMYREWSFFQMLLSNMDMVLAKSDIAIASR